MRDEAEQKQEKPNIKGDGVNIILLIFLYFLQGGTYGFKMALPIILQNRNVSYADQAELSITGYPFSFKLLWAPIVDCMFSKRIGRRKTWVIPMQYLMGLSMFCVSMYLDDWLGSTDGTRKPKTRLLATIFFLSMLCIAIEDVALDGWALTMLQRRNIGYSGFCQFFGAATGITFTYTLPILLDSKDFCNKFRVMPQNRGFVSLADFILYWSMLLIISTTILFIFKKDNSLEVIGDDDCELKLGLKGSFKQFWRIFRLRPVIRLCVILLTYRVGFGLIEGVSPLKLIDAGVTQDNYVFINALAFPLQLILSVLLRRWVTGPRSMHSFIICYILKLIVGVLLAVIIFFSFHLKDDNRMLPTWFFWILLFIIILKSVIDYFAGVSFITFYCYANDARYGGMYMTLWGSVHNIGSNWYQTLGLWCVDLLTIKQCVKNEQNVEICETKFDGFYVETILCTILGVLWQFWGKREILKLEKLKASAWTVKRENDPLEESEKLQKIEMDSQ